jgi:hypothetical protein
MTERHAPEALSPWLAKARELVTNDPEITRLRRLAAWYRQQSEDFLNLSCNAMRQHERSAEEALTTAEFLEMKHVAAVGQTAGEWLSFEVGDDRDVGRYIRVQSPEGWGPGYFWCEFAPVEDPGRYL